MVTVMKPDKIRHETRNVPGVGKVNLTIEVFTRADGSVVLETLAGVSFADRAGKLDEAQMKSVADFMDLRY